MVITDTTFRPVQKTELQFCQWLIDTMTAIDPRITCDTTVAAQFADNSNTATFNFSIANKYILRFKRNAVNSNGCGAYYITILVDGLEYGQTRYGYGWRYAYHYDEPKGEDYPTRIKSLVGDNFIGIWVGLNWTIDIVSPTFPPSFSTALIIDPNGNSYASHCTDEAAGNAGYILRGSFYRCSDGASNYSVAHSLLNFTANPGNITYVQHCPVLNAGAMEYDFTEFVSCSTIALGSSITLSNGNTYIAIGDHTLAPLTV